MKKLNIAVICALVISMLLGMADFDSRCDNIRENVFRLHILANSDSYEDQQLKLAVRDRLLLEASELFTDVDDLDGAIFVAEENCDRLKSVAQQVVNEAGYDYGVSVSVADSDFDTRVYEDVTLPAGKYKALRVLLGNAKGKNWWCVMFPIMCIPAASQNAEMGKVVDGEELNIVTNPDEYEIRFKSIEIYEKFKSYFS